jgi:hypothetical protein
MQELTLVAFLIFLQQMLPADSRSKIKATTPVDKVPD